MSTAPYKILIIDDDPTVLLGTELLLGTLGFETESAKNGEEGLAMLRAQPPDLVVCDIVMPGLDGFGVLAAAQLEPRLARLPFIFLTSQADRQTHRRGMTAGADDFALHNHPAIARDRQRVRAQVQRGPRQPRAKVERRPAFEVVQRLARRQPQRHVETHLTIQHAILEHHPTAEADGGP